MTNGEAINWLINIMADIEKAEHRELWHYEQALMEIREMLEAQPEQRWIPCSERLPEPESKEQRRGFYFTTNGYGSVGMTRYEFYDDFQKTGWQSDIRIDAWMPLPEPWKGEEE